MSNCSSTLYSTFQAEFVDYKSPYHPLEQVRSLWFRNLTDVRTGELLQEHILVLEVPFKHLELMLGDLIQFNAVYYSARSLDNSNEFVHGIRNISSLQKIN